MGLYGEARHVRHSGPASPARAHAIVPGMTVLAALEQETRMAGTSSAKTRFALLPGHEEKPIIFKWENRREGLC